MISLSRFLLKTGSQLWNKPSFLRIQSSYFGAKVKDGSRSDKEVDKSKKSVIGGGATASDSERGTTTMKIKQASQQAESIKVVEQEATPTTDETGGVKRIDSVPSNKVKILK